MSDQDTTLIECVEAFNNALQTDSAQSDLQELFFRLCESRTSLPSTVLNKHVDQFLSILIELTSRQQGEVAARALAMLYAYLRNDQRVFLRFKASQFVVRKLQLVDFINSPDPKTSELGQNVTSMLLRYNKELMYSDFSEDEAVVSRIRRAEMYGTWRDIEDVAKQQEELLQEMNEQKITQQKAFAEMYAFVEKQMQEDARKRQDQAKDLTRVMTEVEKLKEYQLPSVNANSNSGGSSSEMIEDVKRTMQKLIDDKMTDLEFNLNNKVVSRLEQVEKTQDSYVSMAHTLDSAQSAATLRMNKQDDLVNDHIIIIEKMNARLKSFMDMQDELKESMLSRLSKLETEFIQKMFEAIDQKFDFGTFEQGVLKLSQDLDAFRVDHLTFKELYSSKVDDFEPLFKKSVNEIYERVRKSEEVMAVIKEEVLGQQDEQVRDNADFIKRISALESELIDLKNERKALANLKSKVHWASDANSKLEVVVEETNNLWRFMQKFVDEHATDRAELISSPDLELKDKMNQMAWLARYCEFLSTEAVGRVLKSFQALYMTDNVQMKQAFNFSAHNSHAVKTIFALLGALKAQLQDQASVAHLEQVLMILAELLGNQQNLERAYELDVLVLLSELVRPEVGEKPPLFVKYAVRCMAVCFRNEKVVKRGISLDFFMNLLLELQRTARDEEIVANVSKMVRISLRDEPNLQACAASNKDLGNFQIEALRKHAYSDAICLEVTQALRSFTKRPDFVNLLVLDYLNVLVEVFVNGTNDKVRAFVQQVMINCCQVPTYSTFLHGHQDAHVLGLN